MQHSRAPVWVSWALAMAACGGQVEERVPSEGPPRAEPPESLEPAASPPPEGATPATAVRDEPPGPVEVGDVIDDSGPLKPITSTLTEQCGACHGAEAIANRTVLGGFSCVEDVDCMVELGLLVPLDSRRSSLIVRMRDGSMPPPGQQPRPTREDIERLERLMDNPAYWEVP
jgi:hypothetical protein